MDNCCNCNNKDATCKILKILSINSIVPKNDHQKIALDNCIGLFITGSWLYGTAIEGLSDVDYEGIYLEPPQYIIGQEHCEEVNFNIRGENERSSSEDIDLKLFSLRKFFTLAAQNNPNKLECFFLNKEHFIFKNEKYWDQIVEAKDLFLSLKLKSSFSGYAFAQRHKLVGKKKRLEELREFRKILKEGIAKGAKIIGELDLCETYYLKEYDKSEDKVILHPEKKMKKSFNYIQYHKTTEGTDAIKVDEKQYNYGLDVLKIYDQVVAKIDAYGQRTSSLDEFHYDAKFASHIFRLYQEGLDLLNTGKIEFPSSNADIQRKIKLGEYPLEYLIEETEKFESLMEEAYKNSKLRHTPAHKEISDLQIKMHLEYWKEKRYI